MSMPSWLVRINCGQRDPNVLWEFAFPDLLKDCCFYPASGTDGRPVQFLSGLFHSYVYADYLIGRENLDSELEQRGFRGYRMAVRQELSPQQLGLNDWLCPLGTPPVEFAAPFATWFVFERLPKFGEDHGPLRFSLLFLGMDGVGAWEALFSSVLPKALVIISPGTGFGGNHTDFRDPQGLFAKKVKRSGLPEYLVCEGGWPNGEASLWPRDYPDEIMRFQHPQGIGMWRREERTWDAPNG